MATDLGNNLTGLLKAWGGGDASALDRLTPIVYGELHRLARIQMLGERSGHVLQPSALVNEAFLRLLGSSEVDWESRRQFYAASARLMRQILVDFARAEVAAKRGARPEPMGIAKMEGLASPLPSIAREDLVAVDSALSRLEALDPRRAKVVELRFFGGLKNSEIAATLGVSEPTVVRDWRIARASLFGLLSA